MTFRTLFPSRIRTPHGPPSYSEPAHNANPIGPIVGQGAAIPAIGHAGPGGRRECTGPRDAPAAKKPPTPGRRVCHGGKPRLRIGQEELPPPLAPEPAYQADGTTESPLALPPRAVNREPNEDRAPVRWASAASATCADCDRDRPGHLDNPANHLPTTAAFEVVVGPIIICTPPPPPPPTRNTCT